MSRAYIDDDDRAYVQVVKMTLAGIIARQGLTLDDLSDATGIPEPSLRRWLSPPLAHLHAPARGTADLPGARHRAGRHAPAGWTARG